MTISVSHCPTCKTKLQARDSRMHSAYGFLTIKRRRACQNCDFRVTTIELPLEVGDDTFKEQA